MKKQLLCILICAFSLPGMAQISMRNKHGEYFQLPGVQVSLLNAFIHGSHDYSPYNVKYPHISERFVIYGEEVIISAMETTGNMVLDEYSGSFYQDTSGTKALRIADMQVKIVRNDSLLRDWTPLTQTMQYTEEGAYYGHDTSLHPKGYRFVHEQVQNGDSLVVYVRLHEAAPFLTIAMGKHNAYAQPFLMSMREDKPGESKIQNPFVSYEEVSKVMQYYRNTTYTDWPGSGLKLNNQQMTANENLTFAFRKAESPYHIAGLEYRVLSNLNNDTAWRRTQSLVGVSNLLPGGRYRLEVRYKAQPERLSVYTFYVPPVWYHTLAVRVLLYALLVAIVLFLFFRSAMLRTRRNAEKYRLETKALYAQMNPHFLFNALSSIQGLMNDAQTEKANHYLNGFASLLRTTMQMGNKETVLLTAELKNLENYIQLERLRFNFRYELRVDNDLPLPDIEVPPLLAQPIIENAVKHGISGKREEGKLVLAIYKEREDLLISVRDNGKGFDAAAVHTGQGIKLTKERILLFNKVHKNKSLQMDVQSSPTGSTITIRFKNWLPDD